jgi:hypothetical protein
MENRKNQLVFSQNKLDSLLLALEEEQTKTSPDASCIQTLSEKIRMQRSIVDYCNLQLTKVLGI